MYLHGSSIDLWASVAIILALSLACWAVLIGLAALLWAAL